eukprot:scaffold28367_cov21-Tisochrysis_lutea.AAC.1
MLYFISGAQTPALAWAVLLYSYLVVFFEDEDIRGGGFPKLGREMIGPARERGGKVGHSGRWRCHLLARGTGAWGPNLTPFR